MTEKEKEILMKQMNRHIITLEDAVRWTKRLFCFLEDALKTEKPRKKGKKKCEDNHSKENRR